MSESEEPGKLTQAYRTVSPGYKSHPDAEMDTIGWAVFLGMVVLFLPLLPFVVLVWLLSKMLEFLAAQRGD